MRKILAVSIALLVGFGGASLLAESAKAIGESYREAHREEPVEMVEAYIPKWTNIGTFTSSGYCPCSICCGKWSNPDEPKTASGTIAAELITVGSDWDTLPPGTTIYIEGIGERIVEDKVAPWIADRYEGKILDIFYFDHDDAKAHGLQEHNVWILEVK